MSIAELHPEASQSSPVKPVSGPGATAVAASDPTRRDVLRVLSAGLLLTIAAPDDAGAQTAPPRDGGRGGRGGGGGPPGGGRGGMRGGGARTVAARLHVGRDGLITVMTGKVECGQGARAELTQAAAEELRVSTDAIRLIMADTSLVPDDGGTAGSQTTPSTVPAVRRGCAVARGLLVAAAARNWGVDPGKIEVRHGAAIDPVEKDPHAKSARSLTYADIAADGVVAGPDGGKPLDVPIPPDVTLTPVDRWQAMGTSVARPNGRDIVVGAHRYPSDVARPGMLYGKVLRAPAYGLTLADVDLAPAKAMAGVVAVRDGAFVGVAAPTAYLAGQAVDALAGSAKWEPSPQAPPRPASGELFDHLRKRARGGVPANPFADVVAKAAKSLRQAYHVAYVQHCPMEPRAAVAEWGGNKLTVWTGTQQPWGVKSELSRALNVPAEDVRVVVPDFGGGFGGKHSGEAAVEAARLASAVGKPVSLRWTREEEFTWAYFRPAGLIEAEASLDDRGALSSWFFVNVNSGANEVQSPYRTGKGEAKFVASDPPLRHGSYRALAVTANTFARESFMDELAHAAGRDPLDFRLSHLEPGRLRDVLAHAAEKFGWAERIRKRERDVGVGLACGTDKGSVVAACAEVKVDPESNTYRVTRVCQAYECGKIVNPANLRRQVTGAIVMGLGPTLREEIQFAEGKLINASMRSYGVPRFEDVPQLDIHLVDRPDLPSAGAGETPIIAVAPAVANALFAATGVRVRRMPVRLPKVVPARPAAANEAAPPEWIPPECTIG